MNEVKKKALWMALAGLVMGVGVGLMFHYFLSAPNSALSGNENRPIMILYLLVSGLYGAVNMGTSAIYGIEKWSILRCTFTHFLICIGSTVLFIGFLILQGMMPLEPAGILAMAAAIVAVYFLIWLIQYLSYRRRVKSMNAKLREWKARRER